MVKVFSPPEDPQQTNLFHFKKNESSLTQKLNAFIEKRFKKKKSSFFNKNCRLSIFTTGKYSLHDDRPLVRP